MLFRSNSHWKKVGQFRKNNPAVGAGKQSDLGNDTYGRVWNDNKVVIKLNASGSTSVNVSGIFNDENQLRSIYKAIFRLHKAVAWLLFFLPDRTQQACADVHPSLNATFHRPVNYNIH